METLDQIKKLKEDMMDKLDSAETWMLGCDSWKEANKCQERIDTYKKFVKELEEMEKWFS